jgi:hypothetical protein
VTGRAATASALYAGFLACWACGTALRGRRPSPYLLLGAGLLEAALALGALVGLAALGGEEPAVHAGYLLASVALLPLALLLARDSRGELAPAPLAVGLVALAVVIARAGATA